MKGMMAAGLAKLSLYVPYPPEQFCFNLFFLYYGSAQHSVCQNKGFHFF